MEKPFTEIHRARGLSYSRSSIAALESTGLWVPSGAQLVLLRLKACGVGCVLCSGDVGRVRRGMNVKDLGKEGS